MTLGVLDRLVGYHLRRADAVVGADFARTLAGTSLRQTLVAILSVVEANPGINQGAVGRALGVQRANMVALIGELVEGGLMDRAVPADNRRSFALTLTDTGREMLGTAIDRIVAHEEAVLRGFSPAQRAMLIELLQQIELREH